MHASPAFQITIRHFGIWRFASVLAVFATGAVAGAWLFAMWPVRWGWICVIACLFAVCALWVGVDCWQLRPQSLRWDTQGWHLGSSALLGREPHPGQVVVALELGFWMLLRFVHQQGPWWCRSTWLPVQRQGHRAEWHALRCAVYSARPALGPS